MQSWFMHAVAWAFALGWAAFVVYWLVAALSMKRGRVPWGREMGIRVALIALTVVLIRIGAFRHHQMSSDPARIGVGLTLFATGLALAVWARVHIGRNWGTPMSQKVDLELVTSGPYRRLLHPIYTGILLGGTGTAIGLNWTWLIAVALAGTYFIYSATVEERNLTERLPDTYPAYRKSTKMLLPFLF